MKNKSKILILTCMVLVIGALCVPMPVSANPDAVIAAEYDNGGYAAAIYAADTNYDSTGVGGYGPLTYNETRIMIVTVEEPENGIDLFFIIALILILIICIELIVVITLIKRKRKRDLAKTAAYLREKETSETKQ